MTPEGTGAYNSLTSNLPTPHPPVIRIIDQAHQIAMQRISYLRQMRFYVSSCLIFSLLTLIGAACLKSDFSNPFAPSSTNYKVTQAVVESFLVLGGVGLGCSICFYIYYDVVYRNDLRTLSRS